MPQVRDPKTGRYTSGGGSSVGGAASTNPRIQKAKAAGDAATPKGWQQPEKGKSNDTAKSIKSNLKGNIYKDEKFMQDWMGRAPVGTTVKVKYRQNDTENYDKWSKKSSGWTRDHNGYGGVYNGTNVRVRIRRTETKSHLETAAYELWESLMKMNG